MFFRILFFLGVFCLSGLISQENDRILEPALSEFYLKGPSKNVQYLFGQSIDYYPKTVKAYLALGYYYELKGNFSFAFLNYFLAHQNDPNHLTPQVYLADLYARCGLETLALQYLEKLVSAPEIPNLIRDPRDPEMILGFLQAEQEISQKHYEKAKLRLQFFLENNVFLKGEVYRLLGNIAKLEKNLGEAEDYYKQAKQFSALVRTSFPSPFQKKQVLCQYVNAYHRYGSALNSDVIRYVQFDTDGKLSIPKGEIKSLEGLSLNEKKQWRLTTDRKIKSVSFYVLTSEGLKSNTVSVQIGQGVAEISFSRFSNLTSRKVIAPSGRADFHITAKNEKGETQFQNTFYWWAEKEGEDVSKKVLHREVSFSPNTFENHRITFFAPKKEEGEQWGGSYWVYVSDQPKGSGGITIKSEVVIDFSQPNDNRLLIEHPGGIDWTRKTFEEALEEARQTNKPLFILASAAWCPFCRRFENSTLLEEEVINISKNFVCYILDIERRRDLVLRWNVFNVPAVIFVSPENLTLGVLNYNTYNQKEHQASFFRYLFKSEEAFRKLKQEYETLFQSYQTRATNSYDATLKLAEFCLQRNDFQQSLTLYEEILSENAHFESFYLPRVIFLLFKSYRLQEAIDKANFFIEKYPKNDQMPWVLFYKAMALFQAEEYEQMEQVCLQILEEYPNHQGVQKQTKNLLKMFQ